MQLWLPFLEEVLGGCGLNCGSKSMEAHGRIMGPWAPQHDVVHPLDRSAKGRHKFLGHYDKAQPRFRETCMCFWCVHVNMCQYQYRLYTHMSHNSFFRHWNWWTNWITSKLRTSRLITASEGLIWSYHLHSHSGFHMFPITLWKQPHQKKRYIYIYTYNIYIYHINISYTTAYHAIWQSSNSKKKNWLFLPTNQTWHRAGCPFHSAMQMARCGAPAPPLPGPFGATCGDCDSARFDPWGNEGDQIIQAKWEKKKAKINLKQRGGNQNCSRNPEWMLFFLRCTGNHAPSATFKTCSLVFFSVFFRPQRPWFQVLQDAKSASEPARRDQHVSWDEKPNLKGLS